MAEFCQARIRGAGLPLDRGWAVFRSGEIANRKLPKRLLIFCHEIGKPMAAVTGDHGLWT